MFGRYEVLTTSTGTSHVRIVGHIRTECEALSTRKPYTGTVSSINDTAITCQRCNR